MKSIRVYTTLVRIIIVFFWLCVIGIFLYLPSIFELFQTDKSLNLFTWPQMIDVEYLAKFEEETGIKVHVSYYEANEELMSKLKATRYSGYDLIVPSDYTVAALVEDGVLKKLDKTKLDFIDRLNPDLLGHYFDRENDFSVPYLWGVYGLGINKDFFGGTLPRPTWALALTNMLKPAKVGMLNDARFVIMVAAQYLFGKIDNLTDEQFEQIKKLLMEQKVWVEMYNEIRSDYLLTSGACPVVVSLNTEIWKAMLANKKFDFAIPEEGGFMLIDSFVIPAATKKEEMVYKLINFLYREDVLENNLEKFAFFSTLKNFEGTVDGRKLPVPTPEQIKKLEFFRARLPEKIVNNIWISLKA